MRKLQLKRFDIIFTTREAALANLHKYENDYADGEIMAAAYHSSSAQTDDDLMYLIGVYVNKGTHKHLVVIDVKNLEDKIDEVIKNVQDNLDYVKDIEHVDVDGQYSTDSADKYEVVNNNSVKTKTFQLTYDALSAENSVVPETIGDIENGMTCAQLKGKPISEILDMIIFKTIYPSITRDASISFNSNKNLYQLGETVTLSSGYTNSLAWIPYEDTSRRSATANTSTNATSATFKVGSTTLSNNTDVPTALGNVTYTLAVNYGEGDILKDSKNNNATKIYGTDGKLSTQSNPHAAGILTATKTVNVSLPVYYGTEQGGSLKTLDLKNWGAATWMEVGITDVTDSNKLIIEVPSGRTLSKVAVLNPNKSATAEASYDTDITSNMIKQEATTTELNYTYTVYKSSNVTEMGTFKYLIKIS